MIKKEQPLAGEFDITAPDSAPEFVQRLLSQAQDACASDVHLQMRPDGAEIAFRLDGVLTPIARIQLEPAERVFGRLKFLARLKTYQESLPQDGRIDKESVHAQKDIRVATYPTVTGEKIVLRLFNAGPVLTLEGLGFPEDVRSTLKAVLDQGAGLALLTGPAGSGKTTTIYASLAHLAARDGRHIITVEDPVEQVMPTIMQTEINEAHGLSFAVAARHLLRQDPQVLVIGEIRDEDTAQIAVRAALTGHLVISTLHAGSCRGVFERLFALCDDFSAVAASAELIINQRLVRRFCSECHGKGCARCLQTGYRGRVPLAEYVRVGSVERRHLHAQNLEGIAPEKPLRQRAAELARAGVTSESELARVLG